MGQRFARSTSPVIDAVVSSTRRVLTSVGFNNWADTTTHQKAELVIINNSFLHRAGRSTAKNKKYLSVSIGETGEPCLPQTVVTRASFKANFKRVVAKSSGDIRSVDLASAVQDELEI